MTKLRAVSQRGALVVSVIFALLSTSLPSRALDGSPGGLGLGAACVYATDCASTHCSPDGVCCDRACAGSTEACTGSQKIASGANGSCGEARSAALGSPCTVGATCTSDHCSPDGVCCDVACEGPCEACKSDRKGSGADGTCGPVAAGTDPDGECGEDPTCLARAVCNGARRCACPSGATCRDATTSVEKSGEVKTCGAYRCQAGACLTQCASSADCATGARCSSERLCVAEEDPPASGSGGGCAMGRRATSPSWAWLLLGLFVVWRRWFRREPRPAHRQVRALAALVGLGAVHGCAEPIAAHDPPNEGDAARSLEQPVITAPLTWVQKQELVPVAGAPPERFGESIALDGDTLLVGAAHGISEGDGAGRAFVYTRSATGWAEPKALFLPSAGASPSFGEWVALSGNTALVSNAQLGAGAAHVVVRSGTTWVEQQMLTPADRTGVDIFATSGALQGDTAFIGARDSGQRGNVYVFTRSGVTWSEGQKLAPTDGVRGDLFGSSIELAGDTALIGAANATIGSIPGGVVYAFTRSSGQWSQSQRLVPSRQTFGFGWSVAIDRDVAIVNGGINALAFVFGRSGGQWSETDAIIGAIGAPRYTASPVALFGDVAVVGSIMSSRVQPLVRGPLGWSVDNTVALDPPDFGRRFGEAVAIDGHDLIVGAPEPPGSVFVFRYGFPNGSTCQGNDECATGRCVDQRCCNEACSAACDACSIAAGGSKDGECSAVGAGSPGVPACASTVCNGKSRDCPCASDASCGAGAFCDRDGNCKPLGIVGAPCRVAGDCSNGNCADGRCCDVACGGACDACSVAAGASADGVCTILPAGAVGSPACAPRVCTGKSATCASCSGDMECAADRYCGADAACHARKAPGAACDTARGADCLTTRCQACVVGPCVEGVCCDRACTASESCRAAAKISGDDGECGAAKTAVDGSSCVDDGTCTSGHCVRAPTVAGQAQPQGVCCDTECQGVCMACTTEKKGGGANGVCGLVARGMDPNGNCRDMPGCTFVPTCDGSGRCECASGNACASDGFTRVSSNGERTDCRPFRCEKGSCLSQCQSTSDCAPDARCNASGRCVGTESETPQEASGCGCRVASAKGLRAAVASCGLVLALFAIRRMRIGRRKAVGGWDDRREDVDANSRRM